MDDIEPNFDEEPLTSNSAEYEEEIHEVTVTCNNAHEYEDLMKFLRKAKLMYQEI